MGGAEYGGGRAGTDPTRDNRCQGGGRVTSGKASASSSLWIPRIRNRGAWQPIYHLGLHWDRLRQMPKLGRACGEEVGGVQVHYRKGLGSPNTISTTILAALSLREEVGPISQPAAVAGVRPGGSPPGVGRGPTRR